MSFAGSLLLAVALQAQAVQVQVRPTNLTLPVDSSATLRFTATDSAGARVNLATAQWISLDPEVVSVDQQGRVTGRRPGETQVGVFTGGQPTFATIAVPALPVAALVVTAPVRQLPAGTSVPLTVTATNRLGDEIDSPSVAFESSAPNLARVDEKGRVFARGAGRVEIRARSGSVTAPINLQVTPRGEAEYAVTPGRSTVRTGDVVRFRVEGGSGMLYPAWALDGGGATIESNGAEGVFVAERPGEYRVSALIGEEAASHTVVRVLQRHIPAHMELVGRGPAATHHSGDTWAFEGVDGRDYAYIGTFMHDWMKVWDVTDPADAVLTDSIQLDARRINDVKIHPNNRIGIVTREGASNRRNGIVLLDLSTPAHPTILSEYTETVTGGVHNVWMEPNDLVYAAHNGTSEMHIIDISDPRAPREVGRWGIQKQAKTLHDVIVQDGYAYLSYWDDGIVMLDVGAGTHGGTPTEPAFVSQFAYPIGNTHVAWRAGRYLFVGDELFPPNWNADAPIEARGYIHVVDYEDPEHPVEVARYEVPEAGAHNVWVDGDRLYVGYYQAGLRVVDISGELRGDLYRQGREIAVIKTTDANTTVPNWPMTWGAQIFKGSIFTSDLNSGLWILRLSEEVIVP
jgi:hypothetical protein